MCHRPPHWCGSRNAGEAYLIRVCAYAKSLVYIYQPFALYASQIMLENVTCKCSSYYRLYRNFLIVSLTRIDPSLEEARIVGCAPGGQDKDVWPAYGCMMLAETGKNFRGVHIHTHIILIIALQEFLHSRC